MNTKKENETKPCTIQNVGSSYTLYQGTEFGVEKLDLLLLVDFKLKKISRIDLNNPSNRIIDMPENGIPNHFKEIDNNEFNRLIEKYWS
jgi:hypothetical protein